MGPSQMLVLMVVGAQLCSSAADPNATADATTTSVTTTTTYTQTITETSTTTNYIMAAMPNEADTFNVIDADGDGFLNMTEVMAGYAANVGQCDSTCGEQLMTLGDLDADNRLTLYEFAYLVLTQEDATETSTVTVPDSQTIPTYKAKVTGTFQLMVTNAAAFAADEGKVAGIKQAICDMMTADPNQAFKPTPSMVTVTLTEVRRRRLGSEHGHRRLHNHPEPVHVTFEVTIPTDSSLDAASLLDTFEGQSDEALATAIKDELGFSGNLSVSNKTASAVPWDPCEVGHPDCVPTTTTTISQGGSSFSRKQAAFTAAHVVAVLIGMVVMQ